MNYRHAFHAGSLADCVKHALLTTALGLLSRKPAPFAVLDTHAGPGRTALAGPEAQRSGEWRLGIARLLEDPPPELVPFLTLARDAGLDDGLYPGSPALIRAALRPGDALVACELHPADVLSLRAELAGDPRCAVHHRDGYGAVSALLPPRTHRRGLILIDPPFERPDEFARLADAVARSRARFPAAGVLAWYPIKSRAPSRAFHAALADKGVRDLVAFELCLRAPLDPARLNGSGILAASPPFGLEQAAPAILTALLDRLGTGEDGAEARVERLADE